MKMKINFVDLKRQYLPIKEEIDNAIHNVLDNTAFILGNEVESFENEFAQFCNKKFAIGVNSGTAALHLALLANDIRQGDEVITVPNTFFATAEAISLAGAKPVFVGIEEDSYNIDTNKIKAAITDKTKAIMPVHLYGQPCDMDPIKDIAAKNKLIIIEDCCQAHGAEYKQKKVPVSSTGCFSFYPGKNLGAAGEGGIVVSDDEKVAEKIRLLRGHGESPKYNHQMIGFNYRMEGIQGAVLRVKLKHLGDWTNSRRKNAELYNELLKDIDVITPIEKEYAKHVYHIYQIRTKKRDSMQEFLKSNEIFTNIHYKIPIHLQKAYEFLGYNKGDFPITEKVVDETLSLPMFPELKEEEIRFVVEKIKEFLK